MPTFNEELIVQRTGDFNNQGASIGGESLVVNHSENAIAPAVTFTNQGGGYFLHQFTFGANSNLPNGVAATFRADWNGMTITGQQGVLFYVGDASFTPNIYVGNFQFVGADVFIVSKLTVEGGVDITTDMSVGGTLTAEQVSSPTITVLQDSLNKLQSTINSLQTTINNLQGTVKDLQSNLQTVVKNSDAAIQQLQTEITNLSQTVQEIQMDEDDNS